jgi:hypothetical protein
MFGTSLRTLLGGAGAMAAVPSGYAALVLALAPRAYWRFGETGGIGAADQKGTAQGLYVGGYTLGRPAVVDDPDDGAVRLDGASGRIEVGHVPAFVVAAGTFAVALLPEDAQTLQGVWSKGAGVDLSLEGHRVVWRLGGQTLSRGTVFARRRTHLAWSFGPGGMRLYVDGLLVASNLHTGGLAGNGAAMLWGARAGLANPLAGTLDEAVFLDRQLSDAEVLGLARLSRAVPAGARYVATDGSDSSPGTLAQPWRTIAKAFAAANPGDVIVLRGGTYFERGLTCNRSGTATQPITLMAHPGEAPVIDGGYPLGRSVGNNDWTLVDAALGIWESSNVSAGSLIGGRFKNGADGRWYLLIPYKNATDFTLGGNNYRGPGVLGVNGRVRIRLGKPTTTFTNPANPAEAPSNPDPRQNVVLTHPWTQLVSLQANHWIWDGITFQGGHLLFNMGTRTHHAFTRCRFLVSLIGVLASGWDRVLFDDCEVDGAWPNWISWTDTKVGGLRTEHARCRFVEGQWNGNPTNNTEIRNCLIENLFDGVILGRNHNNGLHWHHCSCINIADDLGQNKTTLINVEFAYNLVIGVGYGLNGTGGTSSAAPGTTYLHHNVKIQTRLGFWEPPGILRAHPVIATHYDGGYGSGAPWKIFNNTIIARMPNLDATGCQMQHISDERRNNTGVPHEGLNNIVVAHAKAGAFEAFLMRGAKVDGGGEIFDGNLWFRALEGSVQNAWFWRFIYDKVPQDGGNAKTFNSLAAFRADPWCDKTRAYYPPGWEASGVEADPQFVAPDYDNPAAGDWRPQAQAALGGVSLAGKGWPGLVAGESHKGALRPDGATLLGRQPMP